MRVLLLGGGGREHAIAEKIAKSDRLDTLLAIPGSDAIAARATCIKGDANDPVFVCDIAQKHKIDLVIIGPEAPLVAGVADALRSAGILVFGPNKDGAKLEGSKSFTKALCEKYDIPTAKAKTFTKIEPAIDFLENFDAPYVIKADGLAAGKGVIIAENKQEATDAIKEMLAGSFGDASREILIEEFLQGEEVSVFAVTDGDDYWLSPAIQDHKRAYDGDKGPNTGGMGAYGPAPVYSKDIETRVAEEVIERTLSALKGEGISYQGVLFAGLMLTPEGPKLIEYNVRFGDPECQVLMDLIEGDILPLLAAAAQSDIKNCTRPDVSGFGLCLVMAARGYPGAYKKNTEIKGIDQLLSLGNVSLFEAGTLHDGKIYATGGRVLNIVAKGNSIKEARDTVYKAAASIDWEEGFYRTDIGWRAIDSNHSR